MKIALALALAASLPCANALRADNPVIVHEWGTFTSLQDERGQAISGINVDDEPVPSFVYGAGFVHNLTGVFAYNFGLPPYPPTKGWRPADQDVTMRLETPVLYFYPPKGNAPSSALPLTVHVDFHGGLLSQYYPYAEMSGFPQPFPFDQKIHLADCVSGLTWTVTHFGSAQLPPETSNKVWTTPREVSAPEIEVKAKTWNQNGVQADTAEAEHFLFYRGVGHLASPLFLPRALANEGQGGKFHVWSQRIISLTGSEGLLEAKYRGMHAWLVAIRADQSCAFRDISSLGGPMVQTPPRPYVDNTVANFTPSEFATGNLTKLKTSMQNALVREGLYPDEASAMLRTWELSYFKSPGLRFFYIVPRAWVDNTLPLKISCASVEITRVMVGRIELISDEQKTTLARLESEPPPDLTALKLAAGDAMAKGRYSKKEQAEFDSGARPLTELGITLSPSVRDYLSLGRFRDALIVHEQAERPSENLARFIKDNDLAAR